MVKKNLALSFFSALAKIIGGIGLVAILARVFTLSDFGDFTYALTIGTVFALIVDYGFNIKVIKDVSSDDSQVNSIVSRTLGSKTLLLSTSILLFFITNILLENVEELLVTGLFLFLSLSVFSVTNTFLSVFKGRKQYVHDLKVVVVDNVITVLTVPMVAVYTQNLKLTALTFFLSKIVALFFAIRIYRKTNTINLPVRTVVLDDLSKALPYAVHYWVGNLYLNIDTIIMKPMVSSENLGIYQSGIRIIIGLGILLTIINSVYLPLLNVSLYKDKENFRTNILQLNTNVIRLSLLISVGMIVFSKLIILILFGVKFMELQEIFWIISLIVAMRIIGSSYGILLTISDKQKIRSVAGALSIVLIVSCDLIFIPRYGYIAAAYVLLFAHIFITFFYVISVYLEYKSFFIPGLKQFLNFKKII